MNDKDKKEFLSHWHEFIIDVSDDPYSVGDINLSKLWDWIESKKKSGRGMYF